MNEKQVVRLLRSLRKHEQKVRQDYRANCDYWNGDDWGSISGVRDAQDWVDSQLARFVLRWIRRIERRAKAKKGKR